MSVSQKILIVEDEPDMVLGLKDNFEFEGYEVVTAADGAAGLERARSVNVVAAWIGGVTTMPSSTGCAG